ncbi:hypothetical protein ACE1CI_15555 [Aerosakkonemataceae cyanobacterium BLCC-F50]|uniref:F5/8 type C domain-containing protein n=1 Tax=Floridaenema flaviceps BLCC-F50 TaxID=3153642 RepID=A0ABV4XRH4_9CYAN
MPYSSSTDVDLTPIAAQLNVLETKISQIPTTNLSTVNTKLDNILSQISTIKQNNATIQYRQLTLNASFLPGGVWASAPTNLTAITDGDESTSTNLFQTADGAWAEGWVDVIPSVTLPALTQIKTKILIANSASMRSYSEVSVFNSASNSFIPIWANEDPVSASGKIVNIDIIMPVSYSKIRYRIMDTTQYYPRMSIYDLKIFELFVA